MFGEAKDQIEDHQEEELNSEADDEEEESSGEVEEDSAEDPVGEVHQKQLEETILDPELFNYKCDESGEPFEESSEASFSKQTLEGEDPGEDPEYDLAEEVEQPQLQETILAPELNKTLGETSVNEVPVCSLESFYNCYGDQTRELFEQLSEVSSSKQNSDHDSDECDHKSGSVKSNDKKRCLDVASDVSTPLLCYQSLKKCKQEGSPGSNPKLGSGPSDLELNNDFVTTVSPSDTSASKEEDKGSSGKRRHSRWEPQPEGDGMKDFQTCKRRKTRWSSDDTQIKMLGPLQLPDFTKDFLVESEKEPEVQRLNAELLEINRKLQGPLRDDRSEEARSPSPEPIYNNLGVRINTREVRIHQKLVEKRQNIISKLIKSNPTFNPPPDYKPPKLFKKLYIPVKEYPEYNFVGLIIGPRGNTQKRMEIETGAKILLRGKGSSKTPNKSASGKEDLHVYIEADNQSSLDAAVTKVEKLLIPIEGRNEHKLAQLKELALLNETTRNENVCTVCGDEGHRQYVCPNLRSTFEVNSCDTCCNSHLKPANPLVALSPQIESVPGSGFSYSLSSTQNRQRRSEKNSVMNNLYVGNLPKSIDDNRLSELFSPFGKITEAKVIKDRTTGSSRGYGFVKYENFMDAAVATHLNGSKIDGRVLKVRLAESPCQSLLPQRPLFSGISQNVTSQTDWYGPLHFMLPEHPTSFYDSCGKNMFSSSINSQPGDLNKDLSFTPPSYTSSPSYFSNSSNMHLSCNFSDRSLFSSGNSITQNPVDPGNSGSQFQSHFMTPTFEKFKLPNPDHRSDEDMNSFRSSLLKMDFRTLT